MKISLALGPSRPLSRQTAWGCLTANLALPGAGSLAAGRASGYAQVALALGGLLLTTVFGLRFIVWYVAHWSQFYGPHADPTAALGEMWFRVRWALAGLGVFALGWIWGLGTGLQLVERAKRAPDTNAPPRLQ